MALNVAKEIAALKNMTVGQLRRDEITRSLGVAAARARPAR